MNFIVNLVLFGSKIKIVCFVILKINNRVLKLQFFNVTLVYFWWGAVVWWAYSSSKSQDVKGRRFASPSRHHFFENPPEEKSREKVEQDREGA